jgi:hypothetical protein
MRTKGHLSETGHNSGPSYGPNPPACGQSRWKRVSHSCCLNIRQPCSIPDKRFKASVLWNPIILRGEGKGEVEMSHGRGGISPAQAR